MQPDEIQQEVIRLLELESITDQRSEKQKLASLAFTLAQKAEALSRTRQPQAVKLNEVTDSHLQQFVEHLYVEKDAKKRNLYQELMLFEVRWHGIEERRDLLRRLLRDCDGRVLRLRRLRGLKPAGDVAADGDQALLHNLLEVRQLLRISLRSDLVRQDQP